MQLTASVSLVVLVALITPPTTCSLHDALPIYRQDGEARRGQDAREGVLVPVVRSARPPAHRFEDRVRHHPQQDRKSTRLNSSHLVISYATFCLKKKNTPNQKLNA